MIEIPLTFLSDISAQEVKNLPAEQLYSLKQRCHEKIALYKNCKRILDVSLYLKYYEAAKLALQETQRNSGIIRIPADPLVVVAHLPEKVDWDQKILIPIVEKLAPQIDLPEISLAYSIPEHHFKEWDPYIQSFFEPARTITIGTPSFNFMESR